MSEYFWAGLPIIDHGNDGDKYKGVYIPYGVYPEGAVNYFMSPIGGRKRYLRVDYNQFEDMKDLVVLNREHEESPLESFLATVTDRWLNRNFKNWVAACKAMAGKGKSRKGEIPESIDFYYGTEFAVFSPINS